MNINATPLSYCPSPIYKNQNHQKSQKQLENKPLSAKNMTQPKKLALFQSVSNLKIKDSITKKRKSEQNLLKGIQTEMNYPYSTSQKQQQILQQLSIGQQQQLGTGVYMTEGNLSKQSNMEYFQAEKINQLERESCHTEEQQLISRNQQLIDHASYKKYNMLQNQLGGNHHPLLSNKNSFLPQQQQQQIQSHSNIQKQQQQYENENSNIQQGNKINLQLISQHKNNNMQEENNINYSNQNYNTMNQSNRINNKSPLNNNNILLQKLKQQQQKLQDTQQSQQTKQFKKKKTNLQVQIINNSDSISNENCLVSQINSQIITNNNNNGIQCNEIYAGIVNKDSSKKNINNNNKDPQISLNEVDQCNLLTKIQPDYNSMIEMLSHRSKEVQKLSSYKENLSQKLQELRNQVHLLQSVQKKNSLEDIAHESIKQIEQNQDINKIISQDNNPIRLNQNFFTSSNINNYNQSDNQEYNNYQQQIISKNQNEELNGNNSYIQQNSSELDIFTMIPQHQSQINNKINVCNGLMNKAEQIKNNLIQSLTNDEIIIPLSTKSQGIPVRDSLLQYNNNQNQKIHHLSNDFSINKENLILNNNKNNLFVSDQKYKNLTHSDKKKNNKSSKVPKQAQIFKFSNLKFKDQNQGMNNLDNDNQQQKQTELNQQELQNEILRQIAVPLSSKSQRNNQNNIFPTNQRNNNHPNYNTLNSNLKKSNLQVNYSNSNNNIINNNNNTNNIISSEQLQTCIQNTDEDIIQQFNNQIINQKKNTLNYKKNSKDFLLDKLQTDNQYQQQRLLSKNYANVNTLIQQTNVNNQPNTFLNGNTPMILQFPTSVTSKSTKVNNSSPIFYKSANTIIQRVNQNQNKKKNFQQGGGASARLKDQDSYRNKLNQQYNPKCSTTENSKVYRRLSTNDGGNIQNHSSENIIINQNLIKNGSSNTSQGLAQQDLLLYNHQFQQINPNNGGNSSYFPLKKNEAYQTFGNINNNNNNINNNNLNSGKNNNVKSNDSHFKKLNQQKILLSNAQSYTTSNNSTNGNTQHYSTNGNTQHYSSNYQNLSNQADNNTLPFFKSANNNQQLSYNNNNGNIGEPLLLKQIQMNQLNQQEQIIYQNIQSPYNQIQKQSNEEIESKELITQQQQQQNNNNNKNIQQSDISIGLNLIKDKIKRCLNRYANQQIHLQNLNTQLIQKLNSLQF